MLRQNPKHFFKNFKNTNTSYGKERRLNMAKTVLEKQPHFPKTLDYEDFDMEMFNWVADELKLYVDDKGKEFNTYKLFSNQRMTEYGQTWKNVDEHGNLDINFKTITRESDPQKGDIQGGNYNIPGDITFPIFKTKSIDENGIEYIEVYSMKQPTQVNFIYTIGVFTNTYKVLNQMNKMIQAQFKSIEKYIFPNGYAIPIELNSVSDESEYTIDDRKYYSQTYQIKVMGYVITEDDFSVSKMPSRLRIISGNRTARNKKYDDELIVPTPIIEEKSCGHEISIVASKSETIDDIMNSRTSHTDIDIEELCGKQICWKGTDDEMYVNRKVIITIMFNHCQLLQEFISEYNLGIEEIQIDNIKNFSIYLDDVEINIDDSNVDILKGDNVKLSVELKNEVKEGKITIIAYDIDSIVNKKDMTPEKQFIDIEYVPSGSGDEIFSCYGSGAWINQQPWINNDAWLNS